MLHDVNPRDAVTSRLLLPAAPTPTARRGTHPLTRYRAGWAGSALLAACTLADAHLPHAASPLTYARAAVAAVWRGASRASAPARNSIASIPAVAAAAAWWHSTGAPATAAHLSFYISPWWGASLHTLERWLYCHPTDIDAAMIHALRVHGPWPSIAVRAWLGAKFPPPATYYVPEKLALSAMADPVVPTVDQLIGTLDGSLDVADGDADAVLRTKVEDEAWGRTLGAWRAWAVDDCAAAAWPWARAMRALARVTGHIPPLPEWLLADLPAGAVEYVRARHAQADPVLLDALHAAQWCGAAVRDELATTIAWYACIAGVRGVMPARFVGEVPASRKPLLVLPLIGSLVAPRSTPGYDMLVKRPGLDIALRRLSAVYDIAYVSNHDRVCTTTPPPPPRVYCYHLGVQEFVENAAWALWHDLHPEPADRRKVVAGNREVPYLVIAGVESLTPDVATGHGRMDLRRFAPRWHMGKIVVLDHRVYGTNGQLDNWVHIPKWDGVDEDAELLALLPMLEHLADPAVRDVRPVIRSVVDRAVAGGVSVGAAWWEKVRDEYPEPFARAADGGGGAESLGWGRLGGDVARWHAARGDTPLARLWQRAGGVVPGALLRGVRGADPVDDLRRAKAPWPDPSVLPDVPPAAQQRFARPTERAVRPFVDSRWVRVPQSDVDGDDPAAVERVKNDAKLAEAAATWWRGAAPAYPPALFPHLRVE